MFGFLSMSYWKKNTNYARILMFNGIQKNPSKLGVGGFSTSLQLISHGINTMDVFVFFQCTLKIFMQ